MRLILAVLIVAFLGTAAVVTIALVEIIASGAARPLT